MISVRSGGAPNAAEDHRLRPYDRCMTPGTAALVAAAMVLGYLTGTFPTAQKVGRRLGFDPTAAGSRNPGASNSTRIGGPRAGALVLAGDAGKGALAAGVGYVVGSQLDVMSGRELAWAAGAAAVVGHIWPVTRRFAGGKGVATAAGVVLVAAPVGAMVLAVVFAVLVKLSGKAAVGSLAMAVLTPVVQVLLGHTAWEIAIGAGLGTVIVVRHRDNIRRLVTGTESAVRVDGGE